MSLEIASSTPSEAGTRAVILRPCTGSRSALGVSSLTVIGRPSIRSRSPGPTPPVLRCSMDGPRASWWLGDTGWTAHGSTPSSSSTTKTVCRVGLFSHHHLNQRFNLFLMVQSCVSNGNISSQIWLLKQRNKNIWKYKRSRASHLSSNAQHWRG